MRATVERTVNCGRLSPKLPRKSDDHAQQHGVGLDSAGLCDHARDSAGFDVDRANRTGFANRGATFLQAARERGHRDKWLGPAVAGGEERAMPLTGIVGDQLVDLSSGQHLTVQLVLAGDVQPRFQTREFVVILRQVHDPATGEADVVVEFARDGFPGVDTIDCDGQLICVATLLADPPPVAARLFAGDAAFVADDDG